MRGQLCGDVSEMFTRKIVGVCKHLLQKHDNYFDYDNHMRLGRISYYLEVFQTPQYLYLWYMWYCYSIQDLRQLMLRIFLAWVFCKIWSTIHEQVWNSRVHDFWKVISSVYESQRTRYINSLITWWYFLLFKIKCIGIQEFMNFPESPGIF